jgi:hypothetical protein
MRTFSFLFIICTLSCSTPYSNELETVLEQAGKNRKELEKVLKHYSRASADSLKLRAVEFPVCRIMAGQTVRMLLVYIWGNVLLIQRIVWITTDIFRNARAIVSLVFRAVIAEWQYLKGIVGMKYSII